MWEDEHDLSRRRDEVAVPGGQLPNIFFAWLVTKNKQTEASLSCSMRAREPELCPVGVIAELIFLQYGASAHGDQGLFPFPDFTRATELEGTPLLRALKGAREARGQSQSAHRRGFKHPVMQNMSRLVSRMMDEAGALNAKAEYQRAVGARRTRNNGTP